MRFSGINPSLIFLALPVRNPSLGAPLRFFTRCQYDGGIAEIGSFQHLVADVRPKMKSYKPTGPVRVPVLECGVGRPEGSEAGGGGRTERLRLRDVSLVAWQES